MAPSTPPTGRVRHFVQSLGLAVAALLSSCWLDAALLQPDASTTLV